MTALSRNLVAVALLIALHACSAENRPEDAHSEPPDDWVTQQYLDARARHTDDPDVFVLRGLTADRANRFIDVFAYAGSDTSIPVEHIIESELNPTGAALALTPVTPGELQRALEFIGMRPGHPIDPSRVFHWPKGERVRITANWSRDESGPLEYTVPVEDLLIDSAFGETLPGQGFRFVGISDERNDTAITTTYNSANTVLEVPYIVGRNEVAGRLIRNPEFDFSPGHAIRFRIRPEFRDSRTRVRDFVLRVAPGDMPNGEQLANLSVDLLDTDNEVVSAGGFQQAFVELESMIDAGQEPYVRFDYADRLSAAGVRAIARFTRQFLIPQDVRVEPLDGHLFYSAFLPDEAWREPANRGRANQPLEIYRDVDSFSGKLVHHGSTGAAGQVPLHVEFAAGPAFETALDSGRPWGTNGAFIHVAPQTPYRDIRELFILIRHEFPNVYVFLESQ